MQFDSLVCKTLKLDGLNMVYVWYILDGSLYDKPKFANL